LLLQLLALAILWIGYRHNSRQHRRVETTQGQ
jgi:high-affinity iron transporter